MSKRRLQQRGVQLAHEGGLLRRDLAVGLDDGDERIAEVEGDGVVLLVAGIDLRELQPVENLSERAPVGVEAAEMGRHELPVVRHPLPVALGEVEGSVSG